MSYKRYVTGTVLKAAPTDPIAFAFRDRTRTARRAEGEEAKANAETEARFFALRAQNDNENHASHGALCASLPTHTVNPPLHKHPSASNSTENTTLITVQRWTSCGTVEIEHNAN